MASDETLEASTEHKETLTEQLEESLGGQQMVASVEASLSREAASNHESQPGDSKESESGSDTITRLKVATVAALAGVTYDFG
jgi:hypothetical protein